MEISSIQAKGIFFYARVRARIVRSAPACRQAGSSGIRIALIFSAFFVLASRPAFSDSIRNFKIDAAKKIAAERKPGAKDQLQSMLGGENDPFVRAAVIDSISAVCPQDCVSTFQASLVDSDPLVRSEAVQALGNSGDKAAVALLIRALLDDNNEGVRMAAAFWLGGLEDSSAIAPLEDALTGDLDPHVRAACASALKRFDTPASAAALKKAQDDDDERVQKAANE